MKVLAATDPLALPALPALPAPLGALRPAVPERGLCGAHRFAALPPAA